MTNEEMGKVLDAVRVCGDHIEATDIMIKLAENFPDHHAQIDAVFEEEYAFDTVGGRFNLAEATEAAKRNANRGAKSR